MTAPRPDRDALDELVDNMAARRGPQDSAPAAPQQEKGPVGDGRTAAGADASLETYDQTLAAAVRERDRALDKATSRLASVTAGGYLEYDRNVSMALAVFEATWFSAGAAYRAAAR